MGEGNEFKISNSVTTSYYAEAVIKEGHFEDFDSYTSGDFIVASDPANWTVARWNTWWNYDMQIDDSSNGKFTSCI